jgi:DNA polymerase-1
MAKPLSLLIDGDIVLHRFGHANQVSVDWEGKGGPKSIAISEISGALLSVDEFIQGLSDKFKGAEPIICFSGRRNFRYAVLESYKWNRKNLEKPVLFNAIQDYLRASYTCLMQDVLEGDDLMGILSTAERGKYIICSIDKDMLQIPGRHYNWNTRRRSIVTVHQGNHFFYRQILTGDPGDGYTGIPGWGPVKTDKVLDRLEGQPHDVYWKVITEAYNSVGLCEADAITQARVARILRHREYDFDTKEVKLWTP